MNGHELLQRLRQRPRWPSAPALHARPTRYRRSAPAPAALPGLVKADPGIGRSRLSDRGTARGYRRAPPQPMHALRRQTQPRPLPIRTAGGEQINLSGTLDAPTAPALRRYRRVPRLTARSRSRCCNHARRDHRVRPAKSALSCAIHLDAEVRRCIPVWATAGATFSERDHAVPVLTRALPEPLRSVAMPVDAASRPDAHPCCRVGTTTEPGMRSPGPLRTELRFVSHAHDIRALAQRVLAHWQTHGRGEKLVLSFHGVPSARARSAIRYCDRCLASASGSASGCHCATKQRRHLPEPLRQRPPGCSPLHRADAGGAGETGRGQPRRDVPRFAGRLPRDAQGDRQEVRAAFSRRRFRSPHPLPERQPPLDPGALAQIALRHLQEWPTAR